MHLGESHTVQSKFSTFQCKFSSLLVKKNAKFVAIYVLCVDIKSAKDLAYGEKITNILHAVHLGRDTP